MKDYLFLISVIREFLFKIYLLRSFILQSTAYEVTMKHKDVRKIVLKEVEDGLSDWIELIEKYCSIYEVNNCKLKTEYKLKKTRKKGDYEANYIVIIKIYPIHLTEKQSIDCSNIKHFEFNLADVYEDKNGNICIKKKRNITLLRLLKHGCYLLEKKGVDNYCRDNIFDLLYRLFFPKRSGCLKNVYRGKSLWLLRILISALPIIISLLINFYIIITCENPYYLHWVHVN